MTSAGLARKPAAGTRGVCQLYCSEARQQHSSGHWAHAPRKENSTDDNHMLSGCFIVRPDQVVPHKADRLLIFCFAGTVRELW